MTSHDAPAKHALPSVRLATRQWFVFFHEGSAAGAAPSLIPGVALPARGFGAALLSLDWPSIIKVIMGLGHLDLTFTCSVTQ